MKARDRWKKVQEAIGTIQDGTPGPKDEAAINYLKTAARQNLNLADQTLTGRGLTLFVEDEDLVLKNVRVTCFGGTDDPQDSGKTASGLSTKPPGTMGCALPRNYTGPHAPTRRSLEGSPIPQALPWRAPVQFTERATGKTLVVPFIDLGPDLNTENAGDLTVAAAKHFNPAATARNFEMLADIRIIGGAKYL